MAPGGVGQTSCCSQARARSLEELEERRSLEEPGSVGVSVESIRIREGEVRHSPHCGRWQSQPGRRRWLWYAFWRVGGFWGLKKTVV
jgi:hypothetical protein